MTQKSMHCEFLYIAIKTVAMVFSAVLNKCAQIKGRLKVSVLCVLSYRNFKWMNWQMLKDFSWVEPWINWSKLNSLYINIPANVNKKKNLRMFIQFLLLLKYKEQDILQCLCLQNVESRIINVSRCLYCFSFTAKE